MSAKPKLPAGQFIYESELCQYCGYKTCDCDVEIEAEAKPTPVKYEVRE